MSARVRVARGLLRVGEFVQSLAIMVMRPDDLVEFSRQHYARTGSVEGWADDALVDSGLKADERDLLAAIPDTAGDLLLLGVGGGREAIPLARMGYQVTGVDNVPAMVDRAIENAARRGLSIQGLVQDISQLDVPAGAYNIVWLSRETYSYVPTRARRVEMVRRIARALRPGGWFLCQFHWHARPRPPGRGRFVRRLVAACTLGNLTYEAGDMLRRNVEFVHQFSSKDAVRSELEEGGLTVERIKTGQTYGGSAVCRKSLQADQNAEW